jgi:hypothetical protein
VGLGAQEARGKKESRMRGMLYCLLAIATSLNLGAWAQSVPAAFTLIGLLGCLWLLAGRIGEKE